MSSRALDPAGFRGSRLSEVRVIEDIQFGEPGGHPLEVDLFLPADAPEPPPVVVNLHGGGWRLGDRKMDGDLLLRPLAARGLALVSADYRLSDQGSFPDQLHDAKAAVRWARAHAEEYGWDASRVGVIGSSSGGHLAALLGLTAGRPELEGTVGDALDQDSSVAAVAPLYPVVDPALWDHESFNRDQPAPDTFAGRYPAWPPPPRAALLLGVEDAEQQPERNAVASVLTYVDAPEPPPFLLLHGDSDTAVFLSHSESLHRALREHGARSTLLVLAGADHVGWEFGEPEISGALASFFHHALTADTETNR